MFLINFYHKGVANAHDFFLNSEKYYNAIAQFRRYEQIGLTGTHSDLQKLKTVAAVNSNVNQYKLKELIGKSKTYVKFAYYSFPNYDPKVRH